MKRKFFTTDEMKKIYWYIDQDPMNPAHVLIEVLAMTGMRTDELMRLKFSDFSYHSQEVTIDKPAKQSHKRTCFLTVRLVNKIRDLQEARNMSNFDDIALLICHKETSVADAARRLRKHFEIMKVYMFIGQKLPGLHGFRHTVANKVYEATKNIYKVKLALGHKSISTTDQYYSSGFTAPELETILGKR